MELAELVNAIQVVEIAAKTRLAAIRGMARAAHWGEAGIELETGGHFFKIFVSNNVEINYSQFLAGADKKFNKEGVRLGFMITRLL